MLSCKGRGCKRKNIRRVNAVRGILILRMTAWAKAHPTVAEYLTPLAAAGEALRLMNTDYLATLRAGPLFLLAFNETPYTGLAYGLEVFNHTHAIPGSVAFVQVAQAGAGKAVATKAVPDFAFRYVIAVLDSADDAGFRFAGVVTPAAGTRIPVPCVSSAQATVHPARCDQCSAKCISSGRSSRHHACLYTIK